MDGDDEAGRSDHVAGATDADDADEWRFSLSDLEDDTEETADDNGGEGIAGTLAPSETIEPGEIDPENALFVVVGVLLAGAFAGSYVLLLL